MSDFGDDFDDVDDGIEDEFDDGTVDDHDDLDVGGDDLHDEVAAHEDRLEEDDVAASFDADAGVDDDVTEWLATEPDAAGDSADAEPGTVGALSDVELDDWLGGALEDAPGAPPEGDLIDWTIEQRSSEP